ncbi:MAG: hypothetical protein GYB66_05955 [Chloroflexi bacterium]|nr:hypothetical protein [Chloroflexota bacterium]
MSQQRRFIDSFDRYMLSVIGVLLLAVAGVVLYGDHVGAKVIEATPRPNATEVPVSTRIEVVFDQVMDQETVEQRFEVDPQVTGAFRWRGARLIFTPDENLEYGTVYTVTIRSGAKANTGHTLKEPYRWSFTTQSYVAYYLSPANVVDRSLWAIDLASETPRLVFDTEYGIFDFEPAPDGTQLALTIYGEENLSANIWLIDPDGSNPRELINCEPGACGRPSWSPDGRLLAYERQERATTGGMGPSRVWLYDMETGETAPAFEDSQVLGYWATWAPAGRILSFYDSNINGIQVVNLDTQDIRVIETELPEHWSFSPDGTALAFTDLRREEQWYYAQIWQARVVGDSRTREPLLDNPQEDQEPMWSPDGDYLAFRRRAVDGDQGSGWQVMLYHPTSGALEQLTSGTNYTSRNLRWHPNGDYLLFQRYNLNVSNAQAEIWIYNHASGDVRMLAADAFNAKWLP